MQWHLFGDSLQGFLVIFSLGKRWGSQILPCFLQNPLHVAVDIIMLGPRFSPAVAGVVVTLSECIRIPCAHVPCAKGEISSQSGQWWQLFSTNTSCLLAPFPPCFICALSSHPVADSQVPFCRELVGLEADDLLLILLWFSSPVCCHCSLWS